MPCPTCGTLKVEGAADIEDIEVPNLVEHVRNRAECPPGDRAWYDMACAEAAGLNGGSTG